MDKEKRKKEEKQKKRSKKLRLDVKKLICNKNENYAQQCTVNSQHNTSNLDNHNNNNNKMHSNCEVDCIYFRYD